MHLTSFPFKVNSLVLSAPESVNMALENYSWLGKLLKDNDSLIKLFT